MDIDFTAIDPLNPLDSLKKESVHLLETSENISVKQFYTSKDLKGISFLDADAGVAPYLRGPYATMYAICWF